MAKNAPIMSVANVLILLGCVLGVAAGQLLFKMAAGIPRPDGEAWRLFLSPPLIAGLAVYGLATIVWVWQLRSVPLTRAFPFMALGFVVTPLAASFLFQEATSPRYWLGALLICAGIILSITDPTP